ncbi:hypothetical protein BASA50_007450 [Batrachochytrium salamandrivorans]|uniref:Coiled-coil domain-containing protein n=1 Tax=Batrachochytrium salamandrivorans TaxID=1357716 RepID=A0ABQ8F6S4_9FUNG|nr:hypothetical protein BASA50_007450 [Batrachochytrium salamandrivorans]
MASSDESGFSDSSVYEALSRSERILHGSVVLDWKKLPNQVLTALPDLPKSAYKQHKERRVRPLLSKQHSHPHYMCDRHKKEKVKEQRIDHEQESQETRSTDNLNTREIRHKTFRSNESPSRGRRQSRMSSQSSSYRNADSEKCWESSHVDTDTGSDLSQRQDGSNEPDECTEKVITTQDMLPQSKAKHPNLHPFTFNNCKFTYLRPDQILGIGQGDLEQDDPTLLHGITITNKDTAPTMKTTHPILDVPSIPLLSSLTATETSILPSTLDATRDLPTANARPASDLIQLFKTLSLLNEAGQSDAIHGSHNPHHPSQHASLTQSELLCRSTTNSPTKSTPEKETRLGQGRTTAMSIAELSQDMGGQRHKTMSARPTEIKTEFSHSLQNNPNTQSFYCGSMSQEESMSVSFSSNGISETKNQTKILDKVRSGLSDLTKVLHKRASLLAKRELEIQAQELALKSKELDLATRDTAISQKEKQLQLYETRMDREVNTLVDQRVKSRDDAIQRDAHTIVRKYDDMLEQVGKENKRLQASLREMVTANRLLRDQNKQLSLGKDDAEQRLDEQTSMLKQSKERNERLRMTLNTARSSSSTGHKHSKGDGVDENTSASVAEMFQKMKKLLSNQSSKLTLEASSQTSELYNEATQEQTSELKKPIIEPQLNIGGRHEGDSVLFQDASRSLETILRLVHVLFRHLAAYINSDVSALVNHDIDDALYFDAIVSSFSIMDRFTSEVCSSEPERGSTGADISQQSYSPAVQSMDLYLEFALSFVRRPTCTRVQKHEIASLLYRSFVDMAETPAGFVLRRSELGRVLTYLIVINGVTQTNVLEVMLDGLVSEVSRSNKSKISFVEKGGIATVTAMLCNSEEQSHLAFSASAILFSISGNNNVLQMVLSQCARPEILDRLVECISTMHHMPTLENVTAVLQRLSRVREYREQMRLHILLSETLGEFQHQFQGQKADLESRNVLSEFAEANLRSIVHNISCY